MSAKWIGISIAVMGVILGVSGQGHCDSKSLFICGTVVTKGQNVDTLKHKVGNICKIIDVDSHNIILNDKNNKVVGSIFHHNNKVVLISRQVNSYTESNSSALLNNSMFIFSKNTVTDKSTGLMWTRDADLREPWYTYRQNKYGGYSDWRTPDPYELLTLVEHTLRVKKRDQDGPLRYYKPYELLNEYGFYNVQKGLYETCWSASEEDGWTISMSSGEVELTSYAVNRLEPTYLWLVRGGRPGGYKNSITPPRKKYRYQP